MTTDLCFPASIINLSRKQTLLILRFIFFFQSPLVTMDTSVRGKILMDSLSIILRSYPSCCLSYASITSSFFCFAVSTISLSIVLLGEPVKLGFFCNDQSIRRPHMERTITITVLFLYTFGIPAFFVFMIEFIHLQSGLSYIRSQESATAGSLSLRRMYGEATTFFIGFLSMSMMDEIIVYTIGRLRPDFIDVCKPINLTILCPPNSQRYVDVGEYECAEKNPSILLFSRISFLSGHVALTFYCVTYTVVSHWAT